MNVEQIYAKQNKMIHFLPVKCESLYNTKMGRNWSISQNTLYYIKKCSEDSYWLCSVNLENKDERNVILAFSSPLQGEDFTVLYGKNGIFIYRLIPQGIEIFRWGHQDCLLTPYPRQVVETRSRILGFDLKNIYCAEVGSGFYRIFALNIDDGSRREIYGAKKELGEVLVLDFDLIVYDFIYDEDSVSSPLADYDFHLINKAGRYTPCSFDAYSHLVDPGHELIWSIESEGMAQYLVPLNMRHISMGDTGEQRVDSNAPLWKLPYGTFYGNCRNFDFDGFSLFKHNSGVLAFYDTHGKAWKTLARDCYVFGTAGGYFYAKTGGETKLYRRRGDRLSLTGSIEEIINQ